MKNERGQALFLIVFAILALLAVVGLAIDGGRLYQARRIAQNAADASAQAGAQVLSDVLGTCASGGSAQDYKVASAIVEFAQSNGVRSDMVHGRVEAWYVDINQQRLRNVGQGQIPHLATGIEVSLLITEETTFSRVVGQNEIVANSGAMAMTGPIIQMRAGVIPMAVPYELVVGNDQWVRPAAGERLYIFDNGDGQFCRDAAGTRCFGTSDDRSHRGWLNFDYIYNVAHMTDPADPNYRFRDTNPSSNQLKNWVVNGSPYQIFAGTLGYLDQDLIHGFPGARQSVLDAVVQEYSGPGEYAYIPLFDNIYAGGELDQKGYAPPDMGWPTSGGGADRSYLYHIVGFAAIHPIRLTGNGNHVLEVTLLDSTVAPGQPIIRPDEGLGEGCYPLLLRGISLWR